MSCVVGACRVAAAIAATACALLLGGCAGKLTDLAGPRGATEWIAGEAGPGERTVDVPVTFLLRNKGLGGVRVESVRAPVSTEVRTVPPLPATIGGGRTLEVVVIARLRQSEGDAIRVVKLETTGQAPLELMVDGRFKPASPTDAKDPEPVGGAPR